MSANVFELVCYNRYRQTRLVLEAGGDPNFRNEAQETPLMACAMFIREPDRRTQLMRMLIGFGADVNAQNDKGQTVVMYACILNQIDSLLVLIDQEQIDLNIGDITGNTALMYGCAMERGPIVYVLLELYRTRQRTINIYQRNHSGQNAREIAEQRNFLEISSLFTDVVDNDYWSSYYELSRDMENANQRSYPLKIENRNEFADLESGCGTLGPGESDPSNPLASMVQRVLQLSSGATLDNQENSLDQPLGVRRDSIGGSSLNTMTSVDGIVETETGESGDQGATETSSILNTFDSLKSRKEDSCTANAHDEGSPKSPKVNRRSRMKSRQSGKSRSSTESRQGGDLHDNEVRLSRQGSFRRSKSSKNRIIPNQNNTEEPTVDADLKSQSVNQEIPQTNKPSKSSHSPTRVPQTQRISYYTRHDIPSYEANPNTNSLDIDGTGVHPRPPRAPSRSGSRMRRRKTTEVCVTVSEGKIVPYYPNKKKTEMNGYSEEGPHELDQSGLNNVSGSVKSSRRESNYEESPRLSVRSRKRRENRIVRPMAAGNSTDFEQGQAAYPVSASSSNGTPYTIDPSSYGYIDGLSCDTGSAWNGRDRLSYGYTATPAPQYEVSYDLATGHAETSLSGSREKFYGNPGYGRSSSRNAPRRSGSFRAVAW